MKSLIVKRSIDVDGHSTSISLEDEFWKSLRLIASIRGESISHLISSIDTRGKSNLSSAIRLFVFDYYRD
jgi:predicted DNA-binding ribbon-helix-helix protein